MKTALRTMLAALLGQAALSASENPNYTNIVRQYQQATGVHWDMQNVAASGSASSTRALEEGGALFQLWTIDKTTGRDFLLDQKVVGAYLPKAQIKVTTLDPYEKHPRTRADQPFKVEVTISDLITGSNLPQAASSVLAEHHLAPYASGQVSIATSQAISGKPVASGYITNNGLTPFNFSGSMLVAPDTQKPVGEEHFVIHALSDGSIKQTQIAHGFVQVWPVATGRIIGLANGEKIGFQTPPLTLRLDDLYPDSYTFVRISDNNSGYETTLEGSQLILDGDRSRSEVILINDYGKVFPHDGEYTMELMTKTPFGTDLLHKISFPVNRTLRVRAMQTDFAASE